MKKWFNIRIVVLLLLSLIYGNFLVYSIYLKNVTLAIILFVSSILFFGFYLLLAKANLSVIIKEHYKKFIAMLIAFLVGGASLAIKVNVYKSSAESIDDATFVGVVESVDEYDGNTRLILRNITNYATGKSFRGVVAVYVYGDNSTSKFDVVKVSGKYKAYEYKSEKGISKLLSSNQVGTMSTSSRKVEFIEREKSPRSAIVTKVEQTLKETMPTENASIAIGMLFGDKSGIAEDTMGDFKTVGVAHLFAVSGLHIGFLFLIVNFICSKLFKNKYLSTLLIFCTMLGYAYLCDFSPSVCRAVIMNSVLMLATLTGRQYDGLTSLATAGIIILLIDPADLYRASFVLSFMVVLAIFEFNPIIANTKIMKACPPKIASSLSMGISSQVGSLPIMLYYFKSTSFVSVFANFYIIPVATITYIFIMVALPVVILMPFMSFVMWVPNVLLSFISFLANVFSSSPLQVNMSLTAMWVIAIYALLFLSSEYSFLKKKYIYFSIASVLVLCFV